MILMFQPNGDKMQLASGDYWKSAPGMAIATGILLGLTMFANVWGVIWRNQKIVIANARNVQAGGEADPAAAAAGRKAAMASRQNTIFSLTAAHVHGGHAALLRRQRLQVRTEQQRACRLLDRGGRDLGRCSRPTRSGSAGTKPGGVNVIYDTHKAALITGLVLVVVYYAIFYVFLKA